MVAQHVPITPSVLEWALREAGSDAARLSERVGVDQSAVAAWLSGTSSPTLTQFRKIASSLRRPTATFLLPSPPKSAVPPVYFRHPPDAANRELSEAEHLRLREAARLQRGMRWVLEKAEHSRVDLPVCSTSDDPEMAAKKIQDKLGIASTTQTGWRSEHVAIKEWRRALESLGVAVLFLPMGANASRGFSLWDDLVPVIAANTHWNATARAFTLFHEVGHLVSRTSSVCDEWRVERKKAHGDPVEMWCERFAAAVLLPWADVSRLLSARYGWREGQRVRDLTVASAVAHKFKVSLRATVLRLIDKGVAPWTLFAAIPKASDAKSGGGGGQGRTRAQARADEYGRRTASVFIEGMEREVLSRDDVLGYLNIGDAELSTFEAEALAG
jgi:Zn-dependent peptidase ImmA (M78 family)/transcriptional regulator with XRE-family HTH domain